MTVRLYRFVALFAIGLTAACSESGPTYEDELESEKLVRIGVMLAQSGHLDSALAKFEEAVQYDPANADAYYRMGMMHEYDGNLTDALTAYEKSAQLDSAHAAVHLNLGQVFGRTGRYDEALAQFDATLRTSHDDRLTALAHYCIGLTKGIQGDTDGAVQAYASATQIDDTLIQAYLGQAQELLRADRAEEAIPVLQLAIRHDGNFAGSYSLLAQAYRATGQMEEALGMELRAQALQAQMDDRREHQAGEQ